jgi:hypothetical protein
MVGMWHSVGFRTLTTMHRFRFDQCKLIPGDVPHIVMRYQLQDASHNQLLLDCAVLRSQILRIVLGYTVLLLMLRR